MEWLTDLDSSFLLWINSHHSDFFDQVMYVISYRWTWIPFYALLIAYIFFRCHWKRAIAILIAVALAVTLADQTCAGWLRETVARLRPSNLDNPLSAMVHVVNDYRSGSYGFPSCHAANSVALTVVLILALRTRLIAWIMIPWAIIQCYSRAYLGVHYPGDLLVGAGIGGLFGWLSWYAVNRCLTHFFPDVSYISKNERSDY
ncbi:MAG: phosphatase PAP2 family protein [Paramuribaculum sp.]|nr:phosphatase PAP2 family protein [Paramuribaculum sp.]